jgi:hypothetical protein
MNKFLSAAFAAAMTNPLVSIPTVATTAIVITTIAPSPAEAAYIEGIYINAGTPTPYYFGYYANTGSPVFADSTWEVMGENGRILAHGTGATPRWLWSLVQRFFGS